jgi:hypothetical protein
VYDGEKYILISSMFTDLIIVGEVEKVMRDWSIFHCIALLCRIDCGFSRGVY